MEKSNQTLNNYINTYCNQANGSQIAPNFTKCLDSYFFDIYDTLTRWDFKGTIKTNKGIQKLLSIYKDRNHYQEYLSHARRILDEWQHWKMYL